MNTKPIVLMLCAGVLLVGSWTLAPAEEDHHPQATTPPQQTPPAAGPRPQGPGSGMGMPGMMPGQPQTGQQGAAQMPGKGAAAMMDQCLSMMRMSTPGEFAEAFPGTGMMQRVEGRIAFLRAELKIDDAQQTAWAAFARALRDNAKMLGDVHARAAKRLGSSTEPSTLASRLAAQEEWFAARAAGIGDLRRAQDDLYAVLSDAQKQSAEDLLAPHLGMGAGGAPMTQMMMPIGGMRMPGQNAGGIH